MADISIAWVDGDWAAASDRKLEYRIHHGKEFWSDPSYRPWLRRSVKLQTWENEPWRTKRILPYTMERVNGSVPTVWWLRERRDTEKRKDMVFEVPFLTQHYFQTYLFLSAEACVSDFVRKYKGTYPKGLGSMRNKKPDTVEMEKWTKLIRLLDIPTGEYSAVRGEILDAVELLRHKAIHRQKLQIDALWYSMKLPELLNDWNRAFEIQQVFQYILDDAHMEAGTRKEVDKLLFGPKMPPATLLQAHTWLQHSVEGMIFRFAQRVNPARLKSRKLEWPEQCELDDWWNGYFAVDPPYDDSLDPKKCPNQEELLFYHYELRQEVVIQARNLRDAASHRDHLSEPFLRKHALNGILFAIMVQDREQAIEIEATIEAFLTGRTKYQVLTRLREACAFNNPIATDQLGELRKREALAEFLGDKEVCVPEAGNQTSLRSAIEDLPGVSAEDASTLAPPETNLTGPESNLAEDDRTTRPFKETVLWGSAIEKFVMGHSMHEVFGKKEDLLSNQQRARMAAQMAVVAAIRERRRWIAGE